jgi:hypothetical protein
VSLNLNTPWFRDTYPRPGDFTGQFVITLQSYCSDGVLRFGDTYLRPGDFTGQFVIALQSYCFDHQNNKTGELSQTER